MGVIIAVIICPNGGVWGGRPPRLAVNGAGFVVIPERYPQEGAQSSRLTVAQTRNPATHGPGLWGQGVRGVWGDGSPQERGDPGGSPPGVSTAAGSGVPTPAAFTWSSSGGT